MQVQVQVQVKVAVLHLLQDLAIKEYLNWRLRAIHLKRQVQVNDYYILDKQAKTTLLHRLQALKMKVIIRFS